MKTTASLRRLTPEKIVLRYADYAQLPADGLRYELLEGELCMSPAPKTKHERVQMNLFRALDPHIRRHKLGELFVAPQDVVLDEHTVVQPDLFFITTDRLAIVDETNTKGPPDLVIEVESDYDLRAEWVKKLSVYGKYGVKELWHVRPNPRVIEVYRRVRGQLDHVAHVPPAGRLTTALLPKLTVSVKKIWA